MDDRTRIENAIKAYWKKNYHSSFRIAKNHIKSVEEGMKYKYSEITTGRVEKNNNTEFVPLARDYWNPNRCITLEEMEPSSFWQMVNEMKQNGFYDKVAKNACLMGIGF